MHDLAPADGQGMPILISGMYRPEGEKARNLMGTVENFQGTPSSYSAMQCESHSR